MDQNLLQSISVHIYYDGILEKITKKKQETAIVSKGIPFILFLHTIFSSYPEIPSNYPPGTLGLLLNGKPPTDFSILQQGDVVGLCVSTPTHKPSNLLN